MGVAPGHACAQEVAVVGVEGLGGIAIPCLLQGAQACKEEGRQGPDSNSSRTDMAWHGLAIELCCVLW